MKNSLSVNGLSLSQAQSISNLCNQRAREIDAKLQGVNNCEKSVMIGGNKQIIVRGVPLSGNVVGLLKEKSALHACQAFLMENIKAKDLLLRDLRLAQADTSNVAVPVRPVQDSAVLIPEVTEAWGWDQLTVSEICKYREAEAFAAHIGQFIHADKVLDKLRKELPGLPAVEWMTIKDGEKTPVSITPHHTSTELMALHEELAALHRDYEQEVNYYKAKVKNAVTLENSRISKLNSDMQHDVQKINTLRQSLYQVAMQKMTDEVRSIQREFEITRQAKIKEVAALRIDVDARFQGVVDLFVSKLPAEN